MTRALAASLATACAIAVAGCGGEGGGGAAGSGASLAPAEAALFVALDTDFDGEQWQTAADLVRRFPAGRDAIDELVQDVREDDVDFERDIKPAVGDEVDIVILNFEDDDAFVALTQPRDEAKWRELVAKGDDPGVTEEIEDGWWAAAETQEALDQFKAAREGDSLEDDDAYQDAVDELPEETLARVYVNGDVLTEELQADAPAETRAVLECTLGEAAVPSMAFGVTAEESGARVSGALRAPEAEKPDAAESELVQELPEGALMALTANNLAEQVRSGLRCASELDENFSRGLAQVELGLGVSIDEDVLPLFEEETALAVYPAPESQLAAQPAGEVGIPSIVLVTEVEDEERAREVADRIANRASAFEEGVRVDEVDVAGVAAKRVTMPDGTALFYAVFDGMLVMTSSEDGIAGLREEGTRLADDPTYEGVREAADAPGETTGIAYANVAEAVDRFAGLAETFGGEIPPDLLENLEPLRALLLWGEVNDDILGFEGFLQLD